MVANSSNGSISPQHYIPKGWASVDDDGKRYTLREWTKATGWITFRSGYTLAGAIAAKRRLEILVPSAKWEVVEE